ncbi:MAG: hypothetical protein E6G57_08950 [Actinobacteria bacterium]|nr:MAG: hypothetical protein E6G57_08950 [Actinomycetota bacterium]
MKVPALPFPARERRVAVEVLVAASAVMALIARVRGLEGVALAGVALLVGAGFLLTARTPIGTVPLGYALVIALACLMPPELFYPVVSLGVLAAVPVLFFRYDAADTGKRVLHWALVSYAAGGAAAVMRLIVPGTSPMRTLLQVSVAGCIFLGTDLVLRNWRAPRAELIRLRLAAPVYLSLLCAAGLIAVAYRRDGVGTALVAVVPLVLTRFAFDRYAAAQAAYQQTIKALSIVPEIAGVTPLGHGERSALYAVAVSRKFGLSDDSVERAATAARLHHIGYVTVDDPQEATHRGDRRMLAGLGADILRQTRFLADVGDLVEGIHSTHPRFHTREAAAVRVATMFDHLLDGDTSRVEGGLALVAASQKDAYGSAAALALRMAIEEDPELVDRAVASAAPLTEAVDGTPGRHG